MAVKREQVMQNAERFVARGRIDAAIKEYRKVLADNPEDANTLNRIGDLYARVDKVDDAIGLYRRIAQRYTEDGFFVKAIAIYKKILKLDPTQLEVYERLAGLYHRQGLLNEARGQYQVLVDYYLKHENLASAINIQQRMAELEPDNPTHHLRLAELYRQEGLTSKAVREYGKIAQLMLEHEHAEEATKVLLRALEVDATDLDFLRDSLHQLHDAGATGLAAHFLAIAVTKNPAARGLATELGQAAPPEAEEVAAEEEESEEVEAAQESDSRAWETDAAEVPEVSDEPEMAASTLVMPRAEAPAAPVLEEEPKVSPEVEEAEEAFSASDLFDAEPELSLDDTSTVFELDVESLEDEIADFKQAEVRVEAEDEVEVEATEAPPQALQDVTLETQAPSETPVGEEAEHDIDWTFVGDDLDLAELPLEEESEAPEAGEGGEGAPTGIVTEEPAQAEAEPAIEIDREALAQAAAEIAPQREVRPTDLVAEAQVLAKYGLEDKALERLRQALDEDPHNAEALSEATTLYAKRGQLERAASTAMELARSASSEADQDLWGTTRERLLGMGFSVSDGEVRAPSKPQGEDEEEVDRLLAGLMTETGQPARRGRKKGRAKSSPPPPLPSQAPELEMDLDLGLSETPGAPEAPAKPAVEPMIEAAASAGAPSPGELPAESGDEDIDWLDELVPKEQATTGGKESLFASEEQFFDLAAEIEQELADEDLDEIVSPVQADEPSLDEIVEGFKKGVAQSLSPEDFDTHFNLGIAYREMGLLDEAIGEFQLAAKDPRYLVDCCSMLGACFVDKGLPELAMKWYQRALDSPIVTEEATLGLLYEKGNVEMAAGLLPEAYKTFVELYGINSNFRDVVAKIQELKNKA